MGFEDSLFRSATRLYREFDADLVVLSPQYQFMVLPAQFTQRRLYQALAVPGVESFATLRLGIAPFKNPAARINRNVYIVGVAGSAGVFSQSCLGGAASFAGRPRMKSCSTRARALNRRSCRAVSRRSGSNRDCGPACEHPGLV